MNLHIHLFSGDASFKKGMNSYLYKYSYKNTLTPQLWAELEAASGLPVNNVMKTWTEQMGFPVISVETVQEGEDRVVTIRQKRFIGDGKFDVTNQSSIFHVIDQSELSI